MHENVIAVVTEMSRGPCGCSYNMGSFNVGYDPVTGETKMTGDQGPKTECRRCRARRALEADGIEYTKDDRAFYTVMNGATGINVCAVNPAAEMGNVWVGDTTCTPKV